MILLKQVINFSYQLLSEFKNTNSVISFKPLSGYKTADRVNTT